MELSNYLIKEQEMWMKNIQSTFYLIIAIFGLSLSLQSCATSKNNTSVKHPTWVNEKIMLAKKNPNSIRIARYLYHNQTVYYISPVITNGFSQLFDSKHILLCAPDGGLTGKGDEQCSDFFQKAKNKVILLEKQH